MKRPGIVKDDDTIQEDVEAAITFRIAEAAKQQVWSWAKWITGVAVLLLAIFGIRGYSDFQDAINAVEADKAKLIAELDADIDAKVDAALLRELAEVEKDIENFGERAQEQYTKTILHLERTRLQSEENLRNVEAATQNTLETVKNLVAATKQQFDEELREVQAQKRRTLTAFRLSFKGPVTAPVAERLPQASPFQWHLHKTTIDGTTVNQHASVVEAWESTMGEGVTVAVIDDGFDLAHEEFQGQDKIVFPRDTTDKDDDPTPRSGDHHGTAVAGVAVASGQHGAAGVAPRAKFMPIRHVSSRGSLAEAEAFIWASDHG